LRTRVGLAKFARLTAGELAYGRKRTLEIATTLAMEPELMLLDEPTAGMGHEDVDRVRDLIKEVAVGRTVLMVEHNMSVVSGICDMITVLQRGVDLSVHKGEVVTLLGRNGAGRTSTLKSVLGLVGRRAGSIVVNGVETVGWPTYRIARLGIGYTPEERGIFSSLSVEENLTL